MADCYSAPGTISEAIAQGVAQAVAQLVNAAAVDSIDAPELAARMATSAFPEAVAGALATIALNPRVARSVAFNIAVNSKSARACLSAVPLRPGHAFTASDFAGS
jgi:hypothetical protein